MEHVSPNAQNLASENFWQKFQASELHFLWGLDS